jgi:hypothetical protein
VTTKYMVRKLIVVSELESSRNEENGLETWEFVRGADQAHEKGLRYSSMGHSPVQVPGVLSR